MERAGLIKSSVPTTVLPASMSPRQTKVYEWPGRSLKSRFKIMAYSVALFALCYTAFKLLNLHIAASFASVFLLAWLLKVNLVVSYLQLILHLFAKDHWLHAAGFAYLCLVHIRERPRMELGLGGAWLDIIRAAVFPCCCIFLHYNDYAYLLAIIYQSCLHTIDVIDHRPEHLTERTVESSADSLKSPPYIRRLLVVFSSLLFFPLPTLFSTILYCALTAHERRALTLTAGLVLVYYALPMWVFVLYIAHVLMEVCVPRLFAGLL